MFAHGITKRLIDDITPGLPRCDAVALEAVDRLVNGVAEAPPPPAKLARATIYLCHELPY